jgi:hypothetical protein
MLNHWAILKRKTVITLRENKSGKINQAHDLELVKTAYLAPKQEVIPTEKEIEDALVYENGVTSIDFMMPAEEREILEKNLNKYSDVEKMQKVLQIAKKNKLLSEDLKTLELVTKTGELSDKLFDLLSNEDNLAVLEQYIQRKFEEGDIAKAYKEIGLLNKAMLDAREGMLQKMRVGKSGKKAKIALKFTNDAGEDFQLGVETDV